MKANQLVFSEEMISNGNLSYVSFLQVLLHHHRVQPTSDPCTQDAPIWLLSSERAHSLYFCAYTFLIYALQLDLYYIESLIHFQQAQCSKYHT